MVTRTHTYMYVEIEKHYVQLSSTVSKGGFTSSSNKRCKGTYNEIKRNNNTKLVILHALLYLLYLQIPNFDGGYSPYGLENV